MARSEFVISETIWVVWCVGGRVRGFGEESIEHEERRRSGRSKRSEKCQDWTSEQSHSRGFKAVAGLSSQNRYTKEAGPVSNMGGRSNSDNCGGGLCLDGVSRRGW